MNRGKGVVPESSASMCEFTKWIVEMNLPLLSAVVDVTRFRGQVCKGILT